MTIHITRTESTIRVDKFGPSADAALAYAEQAETHAAAAAASARLHGLFKTSVADDYIRTLVTDIGIEGGDAGHDYLLNYETIFFPGIPLYRVRFFLHDETLGIDVAQWTWQASTDGTGSFAPTIFMTQAAEGATLASYTGITATAWIDWSAIDWTKGLTTYTTAAQAGFARDVIVTNDRMDEFLLRAEPKIHLTVGAGTPTDTHFNTVAAAIASLYIPGLTITRSTYPCSNICTFSNQVLVEVVDDAYSEQISATSIGSVDQSPVLIPHFLTLRLRQDSVIYMDELTNTAPVLEAPFSFRIEGGTVEQRGAGYVVHSDNENAISKRATVGPAVLRHHIRQTFTGTLSADATSNAWMIGAGLSNGQTIHLDGARIIRGGTNVAALLGVHTSPTTTDPGLVLVRNSYFNDAAITGSQGGIELLKSHAMTVQHAVRIENSTLGKINVGNSAGGSSGYRQEGKLDSDITVVGTLDV